MDITIIVVVVYFILMILLGIFINKSRDSSQFSTAKKTLTLGAIIAGLVMTHYGGGFVLGGAELAYNYGYYGLVYGVSTALGVLFLGLFLSKRITKQKKNIKTVPEFLFGSFKDKKISFMAAALLSIIALTAIASAQLFAALKIFIVLGFAPRLSLAITALIVALIATKGISALTKSGKYNLIIASIGAITAVILALNVNLPPLTNTSFQVMSLSSLLWILIPTVLYTLIGQDFHQKIYSSKNAKVARNACILSAIILLLLSFFPVLIGIKSKFLFDIAASEAMPRFILFVVPSIFKGLFIAAILAAVIGSAQSVINAAATQVSEDIFKGFGKFSDKKLGKIAFVSAALLTLIAFVITLLSSSIINNIIIAYSLYTAGMFIPIMAGFFLKNKLRFSKTIFISSIVGIVSSLIFELELIKSAIPSIIIGIFFSFMVLIGGYMFSLYRSYKR